MTEPTTNPGDSNDPLEALTKITTDAADLYNLRQETLWGPQCTLVQAAQQAALASESDAVARFQRSIVALDHIVAQSGAKLVEPPHDWQRLRQLALIYGGSNLPAQDSATAFSPAELLALLGDMPVGDDLAGTLAAYEHEAGYFDQAIGWLAAHGMRARPAQWTAAHWRLAGLVHDARASEDSSGDTTAKTEVACERTPIFLANDRSARVLWLVAERLPGPAGLITPHWWRLGLTPLGVQQCLLRQIHCGLQTVVRGSPRGNFQFRWWLELHPVGGGWHERISEADSVQVSAACVALALLETGATRPLLDDKVGVSATLPDGQIGELKKRPVGAVRFLPRKIESARQASLRTFLTERNAVQEGWSDERLRVQPIDTLDDAYEALQATMAVVQRFKQANTNEWRQLRIDTPTHQEFIDASQPKS